MFSLFSQEDAYLQRVVKRLEAVQEVRRRGEEPGDQQAAAFISQLLEQTNVKKNPRRGGVKGVIVPLFYELSDPDGAPLARPHNDASANLLSVVALCSRPRASPCVSPRVLVPCPPTLARPAPGLRSPTAVTHLNARS